MQITNIAIKNVASFVDFLSDDSFKQTNLLFGTNGSGKSSLTTFLQLLDRYNNSGDQSDRIALESFFAERFSKEAITDLASVDIAFEASNYTVTYNRRTQQLAIPQTGWHPVKVFNEEYTNRTIGKRVEISLPQSGIVIGEPNREFVGLQRKAIGLTDKLDGITGEITAAIESCIRDYQDKANSKADVSSTISRSQFLSDNEPFPADPQSIEERRNLGYSTPTDNLTKINLEHLHRFFNINELESVFQETVSKPELDEEKESLLLEFTDFYREGIKAYDAKEESACPFCFRAWEEGNEVVSSYREFIQSTFNAKREQIAKYRSHIDRFETSLKDLNTTITSSLKLVREEGKKYGVDTTPYKTVQIDPASRKDIESAIDEKYANMMKPISFRPIIEAYIQGYINQFITVASVVDRIKESMEAIRSLRIATNKRIAKHLMHDLWKTKQELRERFVQTNEEIETTRMRIEQLEEETRSQDTVNTVFNGLAEFIGLSEYYINQDRRLMLALNQDYDISDEGMRISSAQRKILSLCYFFAEIVANIKRERDLKDFILVFDDPVDSADFVFFHGIAALLEHAKSLLAKLLKKQCISIGQFFVFTHNSLLYDRLAQNFEYRRTVVKKNNVTTFVPNHKTINNYRVYIEYIARYRENPRGNRKDMILIGNMIRRVLEIVTNFGYSTFCVGRRKDKRLYQS